MSSMNSILERIEDRKNYYTVTEIPGQKATQEQLSMLYTRYKFAASFCENKDVLEVACGAGLGLDYLSRFARKVVAGDIDTNSLHFADERYQGRREIEIRNFDAHLLPFEDQSFDVVILYEAIYYLEEPDKFLKECRRILRREGHILIGTVNPEWIDFNPSPLSTRYFSIRELYHLLQRHEFETKFYAAFPTQSGTLKGIFISLVKQVAVSFGLIPKTMKGKEFLKGFFLGRLFPLPVFVEDEMAEYRPPTLISPRVPNQYFKVIYAAGRKRCD